MNQKTTTPNQLTGYIKILLLSLAGIFLLVLAAISLRTVATKETKASTPETTHLRLLSPTPLYSDNLLSSPVITLPTGYYAEIISASDTVARVKYNGITGFVQISENTPKCGAPTEDAFQTAEIITKTDAGTHLRTAPSIASEKITIIPAGTKLNFIGEIAAETPPDGTTPTWYYVHFDQSATTTHTGYVYAERVNVISGKAEREISPQPEPEVSTTPTAGSTLPEMDATKTDELVAQTNISSGVKIFLIILFVALGLVIFALLLISPKGARARSTKTHAVKVSEKDFTPSRNEKVSHLPNLSAPRKAEFGEFVDFDEKIDKKKSPAPKFYAQDNSSHIPPSLARFFKSESIDDEL